MTSTNDAVSVSRAVDRRTALRTASLGVGMGVLGSACSAKEEAPQTPAATTQQQPLITGAHQAGVVSPRPPQSHCQVACFDVTTKSVGELLAGIGDRILTLSGGDDPALAGMPTAALTITVGVGPRLVAGVDKNLPGATPLPRFARERISDRDRGGDLSLQVCANDPLVVSLAMGALVAETKSSTDQRWLQNCFRGPILPGTNAARNMLGFTDGIVGPSTEEDFDREVWLPGPSPVAGGTIAVYRRMILDTDKFLALDVAAQEKVMGRRKATSEPLSGGGPDAEIDLQAKTADGRYLIDVDAHARRAHPLASGSGLMLRRSYSIDDGESERGLLFTCFQREQRTFVATQQRLDDADALMTYNRTTRSASMLVLPGFDRQRPLGSTLFTS